MSGTTEIDGMDNHALALGHCNGAVEVRIRGTGSVVRIDAACDHQHFPNLVGPGPFLNEVGESQVRACGDPGLAGRKPDRFRCQPVISGRLLFHLPSSAANVAAADVRSGRLLKHESSETLPLGTHPRFPSLL